MVSLKFSVIGLVALILVISIPAYALEGRAYKMREDLGFEPLIDGALQYFYYAPCPQPEYYWFWAFIGDLGHWENGTAVGAWFEVGDLSMAYFDVCDPTQCHTLERVRVLDFQGVGGYPGFFRCRLDIYCCDEYGCPVGPSLWSQQCWTWFAWNYFDIDPPLCLTGCSADPGPPASRPRILVTMTHDGFSYGYPEINYNTWGADAISLLIEEGCVMHDESCLPVLYPRPYNSHYNTIHSGYYGQDFEYCPPQWFRDQNDSTPDASEYGFVELCWRIYLGCSGPTAGQPATWSSIKSMYE